MILAQSDPFTTADAITLGIASLGAFTGIASLAITISQFWLSGPRLRVEITAAQFGATAGTFVGGTEWSEANADRYPVRQVAVHAINRGRIPTSIDTWGIDLGAGIFFRHPHSPSNRALPAKIEAGERIMFLADLGDIIPMNQTAMQLSSQCSGMAHGTITLGDGRTIRSTEPLQIPTS